MRKFICFFIVLIFPLFLFGQDQTIEDKNAVFGEVFGNAQTLFSLNYEKAIQFPSNNRINYIARLGFGLGANIYDRHTFYSLPLEVGMYIGEKHHLEMGLGSTFFFGTSNLSNPKIPEEHKTNFKNLYSLRVGYRLINDNDILIRFAPLLLLRKIPPKGNCYKLQVTLGLSFGKCF